MDTATTWTYVKAIRNDRKRAYAEAYLMWLLSGENYAAPERAAFAPLSFMGAQAVRHQIRDRLVPRVEA